MIILKILQKIFLPRKRFSCEHFKTHENQFGTPFIFLSPKNIQELCRNKSSNYSSFLPLPKTFPSWRVSFQDLWANEAIPQCTATRKG